MKNSMNVLIISVILGIVLIGGFIAFGKRTQDESLTLPIKVEEFADFQCPACGQFYTTANEIKAIEGVEFTYNHFPLMEIHDRAYQAAVAAEAAREQGKFAEYHDVLFENQPTQSESDTFEDEDFFKYAEDVELDIEKFKSDYNSNAALKERVDADIEEGKTRGVNSTPTVFVNGERFTMLGKDQAQIIQEIKDLVEKAKANSSPAVTPEAENETVENDETEPEASVTPEVSVEPEE